MHKEASIREPLILGHKTYHDITEDVCSPIEGKASRNWYILFTIASIIALYGVGCILYLIGTGIGTWGLNKTVNWAWDITNFVWWVGIGHAGTLISAVLLLFRQKWRMAINRSAEAMTIFAVFMAGIFPMIHMGRIWVAYWVVPIPNHFGSLWPNFNSPLLWDVFAISTYLSVSAVFWYIGLIPDFATVRDRAKTPLAKKMYGILSFGWSGKAKHWSRFEMVSLILAGLATPLVFSVHSIVSFDFATSIVPGWHSTIYPPYFVAGAVFSGFAMVQTLVLVMRKAFNMEAYITRKHVEYMNIVIMVTGGLVAIAYASEFFMGWYSGVEYEAYIYLSWGNATGRYWWAFWALMLCNIAIPAMLWFRKIRRSFFWAWVIGIVINIGMWFERFDIIVLDLYHDYLPSAWTMFYPTHIDIGIFIGTIGIFLVFFLLFARYFPVLPLNELKTILRSSGQSYKEGDAHSPAYSLEDQHLAKENIKVKINYAGVAPQKAKPDKKMMTAVDEFVKKLGAVKVEEKDDLKGLTGLGPVIEEKLNSIGIYTFKQLSKLDLKTDISILTQYLGVAANEGKITAWKKEAEEKLKNDNK